jgi:hypothetical protein
MVCQPATWTERIYAHGYRCLGWYPTTTLDHVNQKDGVTVRQHVIFAVRRRISLNITCRSNNKTRLKGNLGLADDGRPRYHHHNAIPSYPTLHPYTLNLATTSEHSSPKSHPP